MLTSVLPIAYQPKTFFGGTKSFDWKQGVVCLEHRLSQNKVTKYARNLVGAMPPLPPLTLHTIFPVLGAPPIYSGIVCVQRHAHLRHSLIVLEFGSSQFPHNIFRKIRRIT